MNGFCEHSGTESIDNKRRWNSSKLLEGILLVLLIGLMAALAAGCQGSPGAPISSASLTPSATSTITPVPRITAPEKSGALATEEQILATPTLAPTVTPSQLDFVAKDITQRVGIGNLTIFGLVGEDLVNLLVSLLIVSLGSLVGVLLIDRVHWLVKRFLPEFADRLVAAVKKQLNWLIVLIFLQFATARLAFMPPTLKQWLSLIYFSLFVLAISSLIWKVIDFGLEGPFIKASSPHNRNLLITFTPLLRRIIQVLIFLIGLAIVLQNFGVNLSALMAVLGLGGLAVSLAAKQTLEDMISGFIILIDRPFQVGDRIKIENMDTWGDVESIGSRTTRIRALDNRLVIVPNSVIVQGQVESYTYPDPSIRVEISLGIGYGSDIDQVREIIMQAIRSVPGILESKPPWVDFLEFGDSAMIFRALYWLKSYTDIRIKTQVNQAISQALDEANIEMPFTTYDVNLITQETSPDVSSTQPT